MSRRTGRSLSSWTTVLGRKSLDSAIASHPEDLNGKVCNVATSRSQENPLEIHEQGLDAPRAGLHKDSHLQWAAERGERDRGAGPKTQAAASVCVRGDEGLR